MFIVISSGCSTFNFNPNQPVGKANSEAISLASPILPGKFLIRVAPYVFLSDFEIQKDLPLFDELAKLRDQVYSDLKRWQVRRLTYLHLLGRTRPTGFKA